ncbi:MAG: UvrD-helicase domain-containing protein [Spirochaetia bacterium]|nr:UvrD-helicase domain-containing protein [Spirochaetia bacterium]
MNQSLLQRIEQELLDGLNPVQRSAVLHEGGPLLILAGAGSGKTRVITHRIAHLCRIKGLRPWKIAAVTFTNKAAGEMRARLESLLGPMSTDLQVKTFHSLGLHILRRNYEAAGLRSNFAIYDMSAQETILKGILKDKKISTENLHPSAASHEISRARDALQSPEAYAKASADYYTDLIAVVYKEYIARLRENNAVDFGDLLYETVRLFETNAEILSFYQQLWQHFLIDEYQDTNKAQYRLGVLLTSVHRNIVVVGDDDQSIYSWRGADVSNILNFEQDYPDAKVLRLEQNYRSTPQILDAAWHVIQHNESRREKKLFTENAGGPAVRYVVYRSDTGEGGGQGEVRGIISRIRRLRSEGVSLSNMAIFYRTNAQSRLFEEGLRRESIPYVLIGGVRFYERKEIKDIMAYLSCVVNHEDTLSLMRIINVPPRGLGESGLAKLEHFVPVAGGWIEAMERAGELGGLRAALKVKALAGHIHRWREMYQHGEPPSVIVESVLNDTGYVDWLRSEGSPEAESRVENLQEFVTSVQEYEEGVLRTARETVADPERPVGLVPGQPDLAGFLQGITLLTSETDPEQSAGTERLSLMTLHNAKGLEFGYVFIAGFEEGFLPHAMSVDEGNIEEERRLMYVGITRARLELMLTRVRYRRIFGAMQPRMPSRFLEEMRPAGIKEENEDDGNPGYPAASGGVRRPMGTVPPRGRSAKYPNGARVRHEKYGAGTIVHAEDTPSGQKISIEFELDHRVRTFLTDYTPLVLL